MGIPTVPDMPTKELPLSKEGVFLPITTSDSVSSASEDFLSGHSSNLQGNSTDSHTSSPTLPKPVPVPAVIPTIQTQPRPKQTIGYNSDSLNPAVIMERVIQFFPIPHLEKFKLVPRSAFAPTLRRFASLGDTRHSVTEESLFSEQDGKIFITLAKVDETNDQDDAIIDFQRVSRGAPIVIGNTTLHYPTLDPNDNDQILAQQSKVKACVKEHQHTYPHFFNNYAQYMGGFLSHVATNTGGDVQQTGKMLAGPPHRFDASQAMMLFGEFDKADGTKEPYCVAIEHHLGFQINNDEAATEYPIYFPENSVIKIYRANENGIYVDGIYAIDTEQVEDILANKIEPQPGIDDERRALLNQYLNISLESTQVVNYTMLKRQRFAVDAWLQENDFKKSPFTAMIKNNLQDQTKLEAQHYVELIEIPEPGYRKKRYAVSKTSYTYEGQPIGEIAALYEHVEGKGYYLAGTYATQPMVKELLLHDGKKNKITITPAHLELVKMQQYLKNVIEHLEKIMPVSLRKSTMLPLSVISTRQMQPILKDARTILTHAKVTIDEITLFTPQVALGDKAGTDSIALTTLKTHSQLKAILISMALILLGLSVLAAALYITVHSIGTGSFLGFELAKIGTDLIILGSVGILSTYVAAMGTAVGGGLLLKTAYDNSIHKNKAIVALEQVQKISPSVTPS